MSRGTRSHGNDAAGLLSIGELERRTGVPGATLRTWEARYGAFDPQRLPGGHRRYTEADVDLVAEILRRRSAGQQLVAAIEAATAARQELDPSVFATMRRGHPWLRAHVLAKSRLLALTRAMEDECCARAEAPVLFGCFQERRFYDRSRKRWLELARTARTAVVMADFDDTRGPRQGPELIPLPPGAVLRREWVLVCDAPDYPGCLAGWEIPGQEHAEDGRRRFETVLSVDPQVVRSAARACAGLAASFTDSARVIDELEELTEPAREGSPDLRRAESIFDRMLDYLEDASANDPASRDSRR